VPVKHCFKDFFPDADPKIVDVLSQLLEFNPYYRPTARHLLQNSLFDEIRQKQQELPSKIRIKLHIDKEKYYKDVEQDGSDNI
jgi:serine/threonine protein kinase